jgi:hypothetical protein
MKTAIALVVTLLLTAPAYAKLTPFDSQKEPVPDVASVYTGPAAAMLEHGYFQAPPQQIQPSTAKRLTPCTVQMVVFDKSRLAQACY